jgi:hypothetical protein
MKLVWFSEKPGSGQKAWISNQWRWTVVIPSDIRDIQDVTRGYLYYPLACVFILSFANLQGGAVQAGIIL